MAVADTESVALPFVLRARGFAHLAARPPSAVDMAGVLGDMQALLEATRAEVQQFSVAQAQILDLLKPQRGDLPVSGPTEVLVADAENDDLQDSTLEFRLFRFFEIRRGRRTLDRWGSRKARLLLAYLAMRGDAPATRESLIDIFWPDSSPDRGANNLSIAVHQIRARLSELVPGGDRGIRVEQGRHRLSPDIRVSIDIVDFDEHIARARSAINVGDSSSARGDLRAAITLCTGDLLESDPYEEWTVEPRRVLAQTYQWALSWLASDATDSCDWGVVLEYGRNMVWRDACNEEGHRLIIRAHGELGNRTEALRQYRECVEALHSQVGVAPSRETSELAVSIAGKLSD